MKMANIDSELRLVFFCVAFTHGVFPFCPLWTLHPKFPRLTSGIRFLCVNMVPPLQSSVGMIYGSILKASFTAKRGAKPEVIDLSSK